MRALSFIWIILVFVSFDLAAKEDRVALVIGNSNYQAASLRNPVNDAHDIAVRLRELGFDVLERKNLTTRQISGVLYDFKNRLTPGAVALVFYAGHGLQIKGENYFPAVDADITSEDDVPNQSLSLKQILATLDSAKTRLNLLFLDACRNNPYASNVRSTIKGLARVSAPSGTLISYATKPGSVAADGDERNGLYTSKLLVKMQGNLPIELALKQVVAEVRKDSSGKQEPWMEGSIDGEFCFSGCSNTNPPAISVPVLPTRTAEQIEDEYWGSIQDSHDVYSFEQYRQLYPKGRYLNIANLKISQLSRQAQANPVVIVPSIEPPAPTIKTKEQIEDEYWVVIKDSSETSSFEQYRILYPNGRYINVANLKISQLNKLAQPLKPTEPTRLVIEPEFVVVPAGNFQMGCLPGGVFSRDGSCAEDETPSHSVSVSAFQIGKFEVTQGQWQSVMGSNPSDFKKCGDNCPVENVSWMDIGIFIQKLNSITGKQYRLPSEVEWEYACRANKNNVYCGANDVEVVAWYKSNAESKTHKVGEKEANGFGIYDMSGNVWEWVQDCWYDHYKDAPNNNSARLACASDGMRAIRGGGENNNSRNVRAANRIGFPPTVRNNSFGFRLAKDAQQ
jgi:formylglycine-generating enzyme required for sulfatase activity